MGPECTRFPVARLRCAKALSDQMLSWQTEALLEREIRHTKRTVYVRPEIVVEIAFDGLLPSTRYPGGMAPRMTYPHP